MPVAIGLGFIVDSNEPIDNRMVVANEAERLAIPWYNRYEGLLVYQKDSNLLFVCNDPGAGSDDTGLETIPATYTTITTSDVELFPFTGSAVITGSLSVIGPTTITAPTSPSDHLFLVRTNDEESKFVVNLEGVTVLGTFSETPTPVNGGMFFSSSGDFYLGS
jgi:hypothetical protein